MSNAFILPTRRSLLLSGAAFFAQSLFAPGSNAITVAAEDPPVPTEEVAGPFDRSVVTELARKLAKAAYEPPPNELPPEIRDLTYDQYRDIRFKPAAAIWAGEGMPFQLQFFHRGFYYKDEIDFSIVKDGKAAHLPYSQQMFDFGPLVPRPLPQGDIGFAGFRIHGPINRPDYYDEIAVFQGASYFRSLGKGQAYGLSARGLAVKTAEPEGEEFPIFRSFWIETPVKDSETIVVHALLDSVSVAGAYRFTIRPGYPTVMDVEATIFPRVELARVGLAPSTSMFFFSANGRSGIDDFRPEVHDSDGLLMLNGRGERLWRPLANPKTLQISSFVDAGPRGFGLIQRNRDIDAYQDFEAAYERRPSLWVEPVGDWGQGTVTLVEIPSDSEIHDNIVAYWQPQTPIAAGSEYAFSYRLSWGGDPLQEPGSAVVAETRSGRASVQGPSPVRLFVIDYVIPDGSRGMPAEDPKAKVFNNAGKIANVVMAKNPVTKGWRLSFHLDPESAASIELRVELSFADERSAETWMYRWTA
jgi:glucans biosynthesis protein